MGYHAPVGAAPAALVARRFGYAWVSRPPPRQPGQASPSSSRIPGRVYLPDVRGEWSPKRRGQKAGRKALGDVPRLDSLTMRQTPLPPAGPPDPTRPAPDGSVTAWPPAGALRPIDLDAVGKRDPAPAAGRRQRRAASPGAPRLRRPIACLPASRCSLRSTLFTRIRTPSRPEWLSARCSDP